MFGRWNRCLVCFAAFVSGIAAAQTPGPVTVHVRSDGLTCVVDTQRMRCEAVGPYLRDSRRVPLSQLINVFADGTGNASRARGLRVEHYLRKTGYAKVMVVAFITEPGAVPGAKP